MLVYWGIKTSAPVQEKYADTAVASKKPSRLCSCSIVARRVAFGDARFLEIGLSRVQIRLRLKLSGQFRPCLRCRNLTLLVSIHYSPRL